MIAYYTLLDCSEILNIAGITGIRETIWGIDKTLTLFCNLKCFNHMKNK